MERPMPLILPEGFFRNTDDIYQEVASYPVVPPEKLWQYWNVYTTTFRRLNDPTASRLESFWWHVMGSDRRFLSGKALAKIYEEISTGPSFTPLRGPSNRFHTPVGSLTSSLDLLTYSWTSFPESLKHSQGPVEVPSKPTAEKYTPKDTMSSSARPPPPHPILKKSRGPSTSGPRPTARFVSPHDSEDDAAKEDDTSSGSVAATGMHMRRHTTKSPVKAEKKSTPTGRKFTASSAAKRHSRPVLARRPSSQTSVLSEASTKVATSATESRTSAGGRSESVEQSMTALLASSNSLTLVNSPALSAKAAGKRPVRASPDKNRITDPGRLPSAQDRAPPIILHHQQEAVVSHGKSFERSGSTPLKSHDTDGLKSVAEAKTPEAHLGANSLGVTTAPMMAPDVAVEVQFDSESFTAQSGGGIARDLPDSITIASRPSTSSLYTPTQPSPTPAPFLGRSKSQLTLLLEKMDQGKPKSNREAKAN
ncbi:hypothetical protein CONLIGDRAFT_573704 [Coniochaeta ligniaria NRRL 30616]|uniref:Nitrogen regulatory protein areA GATA-like domain-containing protein n=1 Tax=Coniochaeta ligniaria NRRL 30616 TaxID=1408157 RepID=A0A1J7JUB3_9PEZI|nr:hypothetical protein CONLIGDRAFT_573704 [Coniochaeta ligniaria NRRL 30616]